MTSVAVQSPRPPVDYPDSDGKPMAENTIQFRWIVTIKGGLDHLFADEENVFVAGDLFWYPVEGRPEICQAPDVMVAFGRPKGDRLSYLQWQEGGVPPQVVFEVLSPRNRVGEMTRKFEFYRRHGVEEYYIYDPDPQRPDLSGFVRRGDGLAEVPEMNGHVSPRLGVRFEMSEQGLRVLRPDGQPLLSYEDLARRADEDRRIAEQERLRAEQERQRAEQAQQKAEQERQRADQASAEVEQLRHKLNARGQDPQS